VAALRKASITHYKAKDLLRASRLELLPPDNVHFKEDLGKVQAGTSSRRSCCYVAGWMPTYR